MSTPDLSSDGGLRAAVEASGNSSTWNETGQQWIRDLAATIRWVRTTDESQRREQEFQKRLWDENHVAAVGQGNISVERALNDAHFRHRVAAMSMAALPGSVEERLKFLMAIYEDLAKLIEPFVRSVPRLKIFRVLAALYPDAMTTIASIGALAKLTAAMGGDRALDSAGRHVWAYRFSDRCSRR